jgi:hypothetical protein
MSKAGTTPPAAKPSQLRDIQRRMAAAVMHPLTREETMPQRRRDGVSNRREAEAIIRPNDRLTSFERLEIYNRQYWFRLYSCLQEDFPGLEAIVGSRRFDRLMRDYLTDCPSESFSLRNLGARMEQWLRSHPQITAPHTALALDMVRLEWAHIEVFDTAELPPLSPAQLAGIHEGSVLRLQPYLRLLALSYPVDDLLLQVRSDEASSTSSANNARVSSHRPHVRRVAALAPRPIWLVLHRQQNTVWYKPIAAAEFNLLSAIAAGRPLGAALEAAFPDASLPEAERVASIQGWFAAWTALGWFTAVDA